MWVCGKCVPSAGKHDFVIEGTTSVSTPQCWVMTLLKDMIRLTTLSQTNLMLSSYHVAPEYVCNYHKWRMDVWMVMVVRSRKRRCSTKMKLSQLFYQPLNMRIGQLPTLRESLWQRGQRQSKHAHYETTKNACKLRKHTACVCGFHQSVQQLWELRW